MNDQNKERTGISYVGDLEGSLPDTVILLETDEDYVSVCKELSDRLMENGSLPDIWVRRKNHFSWLQDFADRINCPSEVSEKTPGTILAEKWNVDIPAWLTDEEIINNKLLHLEVEPGRKTSFEKRICGYLIGIVFESDYIDSVNIVPVIHEINSDRSRASFRNYPFLHKCIESVCEDWKYVSGEKWVDEFCDRLASDYKRLWESLSLWSLLSLYPDRLLGYVLTQDTVSFLKKVPAESLAGLNIESGAEKKAIDHIDQFFKDAHEKIVKTGEEFKKVLNCTSGRHLREFEHITSLLKSGNFEPDISDVQAVKDKFENCPGVTNNLLLKLDYLVKPARPSIPAEDGKWDTHQWIEWTRNEYLPYRMWQVHNDRYDGEVENAVIRFSDWYVDHYIDIHKEPDMSFAHTLRNIADKDPENELKIVLVVDCLPLQYAEILEDALRNSGFNRHNLKYRFSGLPTVTEYNKATLLQGDWEHEGNDYKDILEKRNKSEWNGYKVVYYHKLKSLAEMEPPADPTIVFLNFIEGDAILHSDVESLNTSYEEELNRLYSRIAETLYGFSQKLHSSAGGMDVYVVTDHGACRILDQETHSLDSSVVKKLFPEEKYRYSVIDQKDVDTIPNNLWDFGYRFKRPFVDDERIFFLPRGHNTVRSGAYKKGHMHGGATPEEVIVPVMLFRMEKASWKPPYYQILDLKLDKETKKPSFYVQRITTLQINLNNPNDEEIRVVKPSIITPKTEIKSFESTIIKPGGEDKVSISCYFDKVATDEEKLEIELIYEIAGERKTLLMTLECEFRSAMSGGFSLKDL